jgi:hypothetical protein
MTQVRVSPARRPHDSASEGGSRRARTPDRTVPAVLGGRPWVGSFQVGENAGPAVQLFSGGERPCLV